MYSASVYDLQQKARGTHVTPHPEDTSAARASFQVRSTYTAPSER